MIDLALEVVVLAVVFLLTDLGLVADDVDLAETGAAAGARGDAEVLEDIAIRVGGWGRCGNRDYDRMRTGRKTLRMTIWCFLFKVVSMNTSCDARGWRCRISFLFTETRVNRHQRVEITCDVSTTYVRKFVTDPSFFSVLVNTTIALLLRMNITLQSTERNLLVI